MFWPRSWTARLVTALLAAVIVASLGHGVHVWLHDRPTPARNPLWLEAVGPRRGIMFGFGSM